MEGFRIANLVLQSAYLLGHLAFIIWLVRRSQPTPVWRWFLILNGAFWLWVAGRFMETIVYLFLPQAGDAYVFAANFQYIGDTGAGIAFAIWNLYLAGHDRLASNRLFRTLMLAVPAVICILVFTNDVHHLIYTKLEMGQRVGHGPLFVPCFALVAAIVLAGYAVAVADIVKTGTDKARRLLVFSLYPAVPFVAALVRSATGVDQFDYTPLGLAVSEYCLYLIVFKFNYANIIPSSIDAVMEQTVHPICLYDLGCGAFVRSNRVALRGYAPALRELAPFLTAEGGRIEGVFGGRYLRVDATPLSQEEGVLVTATDLTEINRQQRRLDRQVAELEQLSVALAEENRNIDAYLGSLQQVRGIEHKQGLIAETYDDINRSVDAIEANLRAAKESPDRADAALNDNLRLAQECIARIRSAVAQLREV